MMGGLVLLCVLVAQVVLPRGSRRAEPDSELNSGGSPGVAISARVATGTATLESLGRDKARNPKDGSILVRVPKGPFKMGSDDAQAFDDEKPMHEVYLDEFWIGRCAVTNEQFARFVAETRYDAGFDWQQHAAKWGPTAPVVYVSWDDAQAYCRWAGLCLPTEAQREKAARGTQGWKFPWGDTWDPELAWFIENSDRKVHPVDSKPEGASVYGCLNMAGNIWEWTSTAYAPYPYDPKDGREAQKPRKPRVLRGGAWYTYSRSLRCSRRCPELPHIGSICFGFRVAAYPVPGRSRP